MNDGKVIYLSDPQIAVLQSRQPVTLNMAGQRGGKSFLIGFKSGFYSLNFPKVPGFIAANTYKQLSQSTLKEVRKVWKSQFGLAEYKKNGNINGDYVVNTIPPNHFTKYHEFDNYHGIISFKNGMIIYTGSLDNYSAHDGKELGWAELDETKDTKEEAIKLVILGRLSFPGIFHDLTNGELFYFNDKDEDFTDEELKYYKERVKHSEPFNPCTINTSPALGDVMWLNDMFNLNEYQDEILHKITQGDNDFFYKEFDKKAVIIYPTHHNSIHLPDNYIINRLANLSSGEGLKIIHGYPFARTGGEFYPSYDKFKHVKKIEYEPKKPIHITLDFNVLPYMTLLCSQFERNIEERIFKIKFFKEYCLKSPLNSTAKICEKFYDDFEKFNPDIYYYGDASGDNRQAGSGNTTQFDTLRDILFKFISDSSDRVPKSNPRILKRRDLIDRILEGKQRIELEGIEYKVVIEIDNDCVELQRDLQFLKLSVEGKLKETTKDETTGAIYQKLGHTSDAMEYLVSSILEDYL